jgi:hypothetical protein
MRLKQRDRAPLRVHMDARRSNEENNAFQAEDGDIVVVPSKHVYDKEAVKRWMRVQASSSKASDVA